MVAEKEQQYSYFDVQYNQCNGNYYTIVATYHNAAYS